MEKKAKPDVSVVYPARICFFLHIFSASFAQSLVLAFTDAYGYNKHFHFIGLANFKEALSNRAFLRAIWVTVRYTLFCNAWGKRFRPLCWHFFWIQIRTSRSCFGRFSSFPI